VLRREDEFELFGRMIGIFGLIEMHRAQQIRVVDGSFWPPSTIEPGRPVRG